MRTRTLLGATGRPDAPGADADESPARPAHPRAGRVAFAAADGYADGVEEGLHHVRAALPPQRPHHQPLRASHFADSDKATSLDVITL